MNWGYRLMFGMMAFMAFILYMVINSFSVESDLVAEDYYQQELDYQSRIKAKQNTSDLIGGFNVVKQNEEVVVNFPSDFYGQEMNGAIQIYVPSDAAKDKKYPIKENLVAFNFPISDLADGNNVLKIHLEVGGKTYYYEQLIKP